MGRLSESASARHVLALCRAFVRGETAPPLPEPFDFRQALELLHSHHLLVTVGPLLADRGLGESERAALRDAVVALNRRHGLVWLELLRVVGALEAAGIEHVILKGLSLGRTVYPRPEQRFVSDMDVLVRPSAFDAALSTLERAGYRLPSAREIEFYRRHHFHLILGGPARIPLELHWDLSRPGDYYHFDVPGVLERARTIDAQGTPLRVPANADQLLHAACQTLEGGFADLRRIVDTALLLRRGAAEEPALAERARRQGMAAPLWLLLEVQRELLGVAGGEGLAQDLRPGPVVRRCAGSLDLAWRAVDRNARQGLGIKDWIVWLCAPSLGAALRLVGRFLSPGEADLPYSDHVAGVARGWRSRLLLTVRNAWSVVKLTAFQLWCLARGARRSVEPSR